MKCASGGYAAVYIDSESSNFCLIWMHMGFSPSGNTATIFILLLSKCQEIALPSSRSTHTRTAEMMSDGRKTSLLQVLYYQSPLCVPNYTLIVIARSHLKNYERSLPFTTAYRLVTCILQDALVAVRERIWRWSVYVHDGARHDRSLTRLVKKTNFPKSDPWAQRRPGGV